MAYLKVVDCIVILWVVLGANYPVTDTEAILTIDEELNVALVALIELIALMQHVVEEGLTKLTWLYLIQTSWIEDISVVHIDHSWLLWERLLSGIEHIDESGLLEVRKIVDYRSTAGLNALGQKADIRRTWSLLSQDMKQLLELWQIAEFDLFQEKNIYLKHGVHLLDEHLRVVLLLKEEWIIAMMDVILEIVQWLDLATDVSSNLSMMFKDILVAVRLEVSTSHEVDVLTEGEATKIVAVNHAIEHRILLLEAHHGTTCKNNLNFWILVMNELQLLAPVWVLEDLVDQKGATAELLEVSHKLAQSVCVEVEVVHVNVETTTVIRTILLECILQQEGSFAYTTAALDTDQAAAPVNLVNQSTAYR